jgi:hypothetical protein
MRKERQKLPPDRTAILICGMHRSGTSALTRVLNFLGADLPNNLYPPGLGNKSGHWEPRDAPQLHDEMLGSMGTHLSAIWDGNPAWFEARSAHSLSKKIRQLVKTEYDASPLFLVKDPRISLVLPLWRKVLDEMGIHQRVIIVFRDPMEVAESLRRRQTRHYPCHVWHSDRGGLLWLRYLLAAERFSRDMHRAFCSYSSLMNNWRTTASRVGEQLALKWPRWSTSVEHDIDNFLSEDMRHHRADASTATSGRLWQEWIAPIYAALNEAELTNKADHEVFSRIDREYADATSYFARLLAAFDESNRSAEKFRRVIEHMQNSTSWRVTAPLRALGRIIK